MNIKYLFPFFIFASISGWATYILIQGYNLESIYSFSWPMALTMVVGAFIAGATAEGGGAIAFPVMTLLLSIAPADARVFSLGCQSFGMTSASALILQKKIPIIKKCILPVSLAGIAGFIISDLFLVKILPGPIVKLFFVSLWLSFGIALWAINRNKKFNKKADLPTILTTRFIFLLSSFGLIGGAVSAVFGNGIDIITFTLLTLFFRIDEKIATPTSVILMTIMTIFGFLWHTLIKQDVSQSVEFYLLGAIPVCLAMAPIGAYVISKLKSEVIAGFLYIVIVAQFITAILVIKPNANQLLFSLLVLITGLGLFYFMSKKRIE
jgi:uncharacterized membrane protein YfcA